MVVTGRRPKAKKKPSGSGSLKKKAGGGTAKLKTAADKELRVNSGKIAKTLCERLMEGNVPCGKLLISLAEGKEDCEDDAMVSSPRSMASELASEPEWDGDLNEAEDESGLSQREPRS
jgi:hypothetical protein